ncbi:unnamed protein product [Pieris macdunnoughi]|uniref:Uncharacterized protein n=1 Tax=Pieris macdunnoughi TaxID=345717 RepID=A0A821MHN7_9NEOP|nr:unnamed protein product [Pieris macdunnoughi]
MQGSIAGSSLWNLIIDPLMKMIHAEQVKAQGANRILDIVHAWGKDKPRFAPHKTNAMLVTCKRKFYNPRPNRVSRVPAFLLATADMNVSPPQRRSFIIMGPLDTIWDVVPSLQLQIASVVGQSTCI